MAWTPRTILIAKALKSMRLAPRMAHARYAAGAVGLRHQTCLGRRRRRQPLRFIPPRDPGNLHVAALSVWAQSNRMAARIGVVSIMPKQLAYLVRQNRM